MTFAQLDIRVARITNASLFPKARKPAYKLTLDFGSFERQSSAQLTFAYVDPALLVGRYAVAVVNFPSRNIAGFLSEALTLGFYKDEKSVLLLQPKAHTVDLRGLKVGLWDTEFVCPVAPSETTIDAFLPLKIVTGFMRCANVNDGADKTTSCNKVNIGTEDLLVPSYPCMNGEQVVVLVQDQPALLCCYVNGAPVFLEADVDVPPGSQLY